MLPEPIAKAFDNVSLVAVLGTVFGYLPQIAALASLIWYGIRIYDRWKGGRRP